MTLAALRRILRHVRRLPEPVTYPLQDIAECVDRHGLYYRTANYASMRVEFLGARLTTLDEPVVDCEVSLAGFTTAMTLTGASFLLSVEAGLLYAEDSEPTR